MAKNSPKMVVVHCSDTPDYLPDDKRFDRFGRAEIDEWHKQRGWNGIGYHYVIRRTGQVETGRPEDEIGAHVHGHNQDSLGICLVGRCKFTNAQKDSLLWLFLDIGKRHKITIADWHGHYEFDKYKTCPGVKIDEVKSWLTNPKS